jgi:hypothetical protein
MADETPENENNEQDLFKSLAGDMAADAQQESWIMLNEVYRGLLAGGFNQAEALTLLTNLMWKMMLEGGGK